GMSRTLWPSIRISPESNETSRFTIFSAVVLPPPDGPTSTQNVPAGISSESSSSAAASRPAYRFVTRSKTISAALLMSAPGCWRSQRAGCRTTAPGVRILADQRRKTTMAEYQVVKLEDVDDWLGDYPGEMRGITYAIGAEQVALTHRRMPQHTGSKGSSGPRHKTQEEIYFVLPGKLQFKLNDEVVELGKHEAIRVPPQT